MIGDSPIEGNGRDRVRQKLDATHNAFLFTSAAMGLPMGVLLLWFSFRAAWRAFLTLRYSPGTRARAALFGVLAVTMLCWLEDRVVDPAFLGIAAILTGVAIHRDGRALRGSSSVPPAQEAPATQSSLELVS
jgi:hypothetical protein